MCRPPPADAPSAGSCKVPAMFAHSIQNWWWTAPPAAH
ncbi:trp operon leader peptide [Streptomyces sp. GC420]|nr:trp operon leader peptide [Streptomyces sp. GC420]